jgi:4-alpha-glucanotransferase
MSEQNEQELLDGLAERCGIALDYYDIWGRRHEISNQTKRAILAAMGLRVATVDELQHELSVCEEEPWRQPCEAVLVREAGKDWGAWSVRLPVSEAEEREVRIQWGVRDESGCLLQQGESGPGLMPVETRLVEGRRYARFDLPVPTGLALGYYDLAARAQTGAGTVEGTLRLIVVPSRCYIPPRLIEGGRTWGLALPLYALRSTMNWGVGDFGDLADFVDWAAHDLGAGVIGLNPLHALKNTRPYHISPYSPDSRLYLNVLYLAMEQIPELQESEAAQRLLEDSTFHSRLESLRKNDLVDYDQVYAAKREILELLFATFQARHLVGSAEVWQPRTERGRAFERFVREEGELLENFALFQALSEELRRVFPHLWVWQEWPEPYRDPRSAAVAAFRARQGGRIQFHQYLQWVAHEQLERAAARARAAGMPVGLYHDLALGSDRSGSDAWTFQDVLALGADSGCPPDAFAPEGQNWGLPPINPRRLRASGYKMFTALLRNNLTYGGALRLDHVMGLFRLFWIPRGLPASAGAYVQYQAEDLLGILALESLRHKAIIVGEDLGTVPESVRERLAAAGVLSYRVLYFERCDDGNWKAPGAYPDHAMAVVTTHDLPTLSGFWSAEDIETRYRLGFYESEAARSQALEERQRDKARLLGALKAEGLLPEGVTDNPASVPFMTSELCRAIHMFLAHTPSWIMMASLEDCLGEPAQMNVPGTLDSYPNWSRKMRLSLEQLRDDQETRLLAATLREIRPARP